MENNKYKKYNSNARFYLAPVLSVISVFPVPSSRAVLYDVAAVLFM